MDMSFLKDLVGIGTGLWQMFQQQDMFNFQKGIATDSMNMQKDLFSENKEDRKFRRDFDFSMPGVS